jgi:hypothetical protein
VKARLRTAIALALVLSCAAPLGGGSGSRSSIEAVLQKRAVAVAGNDAAAFRSTVDEARPALRRTQQDLFDMMRARSGSTMTKVLKLETYGAYTRAYVDDSPELMLLGASGPLSYKRVYFRQEAGTWLLTEPKADELGAEKRQRIGDVDVEYWAIDDDIVEAVARAVTAERAEVAKLVPSTNTSPVSLRLYPTSESIGLAIVSGAAAAHPINMARDATLRVYDLWWTASANELAPFSRFAFRDQLLGMAREQLAPLAYVRMDWWLRHGLGLAAGGPDTKDAMRGVCAEPLTWKQMFDGPQKADDMGGGGMGMGADTFVPTYEAFMSPTAPRAFAEARSMVEYLRAAKGEHAYWDLVIAYGNGAGSSDAYANAINLSPERFYSEWLTWARARC